MVDSNIRLYYGYPGSEARVVPAPAVAISTELNYANDNVIGYKYILTLTGYITAIDTRNSETALQGFDEVLVRADEMRNIFNKNGANLIVKDIDNNDLLKAHGSKIVSINMDPNNNNWVNYINYSVVIEFNEIDYIGCDNNSENSCSDVKVGNYANNLVNISKHKIKTFNDSWQINLGDNIYNNLYGLPNEHFEVTYTISAEGYHSYQKDTGYVLPAWEQAKNFCQDRLYDQIRNGLISNILKTQTNTACEPDNSSTIDSIHDIDTDEKGILNLNSNRYDIFNEKINCETSESNGTFSLTYSAIIKDIHTVNNFDSHSNCIHTVNITKQISDNNTERAVQVNVNGTIQGLVRGGLINGNYQLELPQQGTLLINRDNNVNKYDNAQRAYNQEIYGYGDFRLNFKNLIGITFGVFGVNCSSDNGPAPNDYSSNHNYNEGQITYAATFNSKNVCLGNTYYSNVTANVKDPVESIVEFTIPGRAKTYIQKLNTYSQKTITLNIEGRITPDCCSDFNLYAQRYCDQNEALASILPASQIPFAVLTEESHNINPLDGSFNVQRVYTYYYYLGN